MPRVMPVLSLRHRSRKIGDEMKYRVWVRLEGEYDDIEADTPDEAFVIASDAAMSGGDWEYSVYDEEGNVVD